MQELVDALRRQPTPKIFNRANRLLLVGDLEPNFSALRVPEVPHRHGTIIERDDRATLFGLSIETPSWIKKERVHHFDPYAFDDQLEIFEQVSISHTEIVEQVLLERRGATV